MKRFALTDQQVKNITPTKAKGVTQLTDGQGLYLKLQWAPDGQPSGRGHQWRFDYTRPTNSKRNTLSLGAYPAITLALARDGAAKARSLVAQGTDPGAVKEASQEAQKAADLVVKVERERADEGLAAAGTLQGVAEDCHGRRLRTGKWTALHAGQWLGMMKRHVFAAWPAISRKPIGDVTAADVLAIVEPLEVARMRATADCVRKYLTQVFNYAMIHKLCQGNPAYAARAEIIHTGTLGNNPAATRPETLRPVLLAIQAWPTVVTRAALQMQAMLFQRPADTCGMRWADVDLDAGVWTIQAGPRTKLHKSLGGAPHVVPLSRQAVALLRTLHPLTGSSEWVFESPNKPRHPITNDTLTNALRNMGFGDVQTAHGFRATARTMIDERLGMPASHIEAHLAHSGGMQKVDGSIARDPLSRAYNRATWLDQRVVMVQAWADYLETLVSGAAVLKLAA
jgi:integrase